MLGLETYLEELASASIQLKRFPTLGPSYFKTSVQQPYLTNLIEELASAGIQLKRFPTLGPSYFKTSVRQPYLTNLIQNLTTRFEDKSIITAFDLFNPTSIPSDPSEFVKFGNENVRKLSEHYQSSGILNGIENC